MNILSFTINNAYNSTIYKMRLIYNHQVFLPKCFFFCFFLLETRILKKSDFDMLPYMRKKHKQSNNGTQHAPDTTWTTTN